MGKDAADKKIKKDKKEKKEKRVSDVDGVKKSKKEKKASKDVDVDMTDALEAELEKAPEDSMVRVVTTDLVVAPATALVPFAEPLTTDAKELKKVLRTVKKCKFSLFFRACFFPIPVLSIMYVCDAASS
jgi:H/ACA ribonucleoprotein complex subunit 2